MYSQNDEQKHILDYFKGVNNGLFIEIGAYHPFQFSNTRCLVELGWKGVYVEPSPICAEHFKKEYLDNKNIVLVEKAIMPNNVNNMVVFYESGGDAVSSTSTEHVRKWTEGNGAENKPVFKEIRVPAMPIVDFLLKYNGDNCDFFNLDVESLNIQIFREIPFWFWKRVKLVCIEHDGNIIEISARLTGEGFSVISINSENIIMGK